MAGGSVKLAIYSTFKDDGAKQAERAMNRFTKEFNKAHGIANGTPLDDATRALVEQSIAADQAAAKWQGYSDKLGAAGTAITKYASAEAGAVMAVTTKLASDYEDGFAKVKTIMDKSAEAPEQMSAEILKLSTDTGKAATELTEATYQAISASVETEKAAGFTGKAVNLAKAGFTDTATSVDTLTTIINAYKMSAEDAVAISDKLIQTQNDGKTTVGELGAHLGGLIPTAAALNVGLDDVTTSLAIMTKQGLPTADSTTALKSTLKELADEGSTVSGVLRDKTGKSFGQLMNDGRSLGDVIEILYQSVEGNGEAFNNLWGNVRAGTGSLMIANAGVSEYNAEMEKMRSSAGNTADALEDLATPSAKANKAVNALKNTGVELGEGFLGFAAPGLEAAAGAAQGLYAEFSALPDSQKSTIAGLVGITAASGPTVLGLSKVAGGLASAETRLAGYAAKLAASGTATDGMVRAVSLASTALSGPAVAAAGAGAVALGLVGLAAYDAWKRSDEFTGATERLTKACTSGTPSVANARVEVGAYGDVMERTAVSATELIAKQSDLARSIEERNASAQEEISSLESARRAISEYMNQTDLTAQQQGELQAAVDLVNEKTDAQIQVLDLATGSLADQEGAVYDNVDAIGAYIDAKERQIRVDALDEDRAEAYKARRDAMKELVQAQRQLEDAEWHLKYLGDDAPASEVAQYQSQVESLRAQIEKLQPAYDSAAEAVAAIEEQIAAVGESSDETTRSLESLTRQSDAFAELDGATLRAFVGQLESTGVSVEQFAGLSEDNMKDLAVAYHGSTSDIISALGRLGVELPAAAEQGTSGAVAAVNDAAPAAAAASSSLYAAVMSAQAALPGGLGAKASEAMSRFKGGIEEGEGPVSGAASVIAAAAHRVGDGDYYEYGNHAARNFAEGLKDGDSAIRGAAGVIAETAQSILGHSVPKSGPLHNGGKGEAEWGAHAIENFARGMEGRTYLVASASAAVARAAAAPMRGARAQGGAPASAWPLSATVDRAAAREIGAAVAAAIGDAITVRNYNGDITVTRGATAGEVLELLDRALDLEEA